MKRIATIGFGLGLLIIGILIYLHYQKHPSDSMIRRKLPGTWVPNVADGRSHIFKLAADGHWTEQITGKIRTGRLEGTWQFKDGLLITTITTNDLDMQVPSTHSSRIIQIDSHEFIVSNRQMQVVYTKIEP